MASTSILVRTKYNRDDFSGNTLFGEMKDNAYFPWLVMSQQFACTWGTMRWPCPGVPTMVQCMSDLMVFGLVNMEVMIRKGVTLETADWFSHTASEQALTEQDITVVVLKKGEGLYIPAGCWHHVRSLSPSWSISFWF
jgi:hypothetical protein